MPPRLSDPPPSANYWSWFAPTLQAEAQEKLEAGYVVTAFPNGGIPTVWTTPEGYRFYVRRYGARTEDQLFRTPTEAMRAFWEAEAAL